VRARTRARPQNARGCAARRTMVEMLDASGEPGADGPAPRARRRRVNINTDDESEIRELPGVSFIEARRICMERPFQDMHELLNVRGMSRDLVQQWEAGRPLLRPARALPPAARALRALDRPGLTAQLLTVLRGAGGIDIAFEDPFLAFEKVQQPRRSTAIAPSPAPIPVSPAPTLAPSPAPSNRLQQQAPSSRRPPLPRLGLRSLLHLCDPSALMRFSLHFAPHALAQLSLLARRRPVSACMSFPLASSAAPPSPATLFSDHGDRRAVRETRGSLPAARKNPTGSTGSRPG